MNLANGHYSSFSALSLSCVEIKLDTANSFAGLIHTSHLTGVVALEMMLGYSNLNKLMAYTGKGGELLFQDNMCCVL